MSDFDLTTLPPLVAQEQDLVDRRVQYRWRIDFSVINSGSGLAAGESAKFATLPAGFVQEDVVPILRTAEGVAATLDIGTEANVDALADGLDVNGTPDAAIALGGSEANSTGTYYHAATDLVVATPAAAATLDDAVVDVVVTGFLVATT